MQRIDGRLIEIFKEGKAPDRTRPQLNLDQQYVIHIPLRIDFKVSENKESIIGFTDGSKDEKNNTGYGLHIIDMETNEGYSEHGKLNNTNSVFQAETIAIEQAIKYLLNKQTKDRNIIIYSDSQASLKSLEKTTIKNESTIKCHKCQTQPEK